MRLVRYQGGTSHQSDWPIGFSSHLSGKTTTLFWSVFPVGDLEGSSSWRRDGDRDQRKVMVLGWHQAKPPALYARKSPTQTEAVLCLSMLNFYHRWFYWWKTAILQRLRNWLERRASCISVLDNHQKWRVRHVYHSTWDTGYWWQIIMASVGIYRRPTTLCCFFYRVGQRPSLSTCLTWHWKVV